MTVRTYLAGLLITYVLFSSTLVSSMHRLGHNSGDFNQFVEDGTLAGQTGRLGEALPLEYPPTSRPLFMLMATRPQMLTLACWWLLHVWMYWQIAVWLGACFGVADARRQLTSIASVIALALTGIVSDLSVGQLTGLIVFGIVGAFECDRRGRPILAGGLLAITLLVKPLPVCLLLYFLLRRRWATVGACVAVYALLGPLLLVFLFGWDEQAEGWRWFFSSTAQTRSPLHVFDRWADMQGHILTYRESGLAASLIRLFSNVAYDKHGASVQVATLAPRVLLGIWLSLIAVPLLWAAWLTLRHHDRSVQLHIYAAVVGVMLLANPKFISYWLAAGMVLAAPLAARCYAARRAGTYDAIGLAALAAWVVFGMTLGMIPALSALRAAGCIPFGILAMTVANLIHARRHPSPKHNGCHWQLACQCNDSAGCK
ncbi:MAG: glycosyltransferase family 87 protein [Planctomycetota bacterium]